MLSQVNINKDKLYAVYGTLRSSQSRNGIMQDSGARFLGYDRLEGFNLFNLGSFPCITPTTEPVAPVVIEVWKGPANLLNTLDNIEGYPNLYDRQEVNTQYGKSTIYFMDRQRLSHMHRFVPIKSGDWNER